MKCSLNFFMQLVQCNCMTCKLFFYAVCLETEVLMISQAELSIEIIVQFTCSAHSSINFKLLTSKVFFHPLPKLKKFSGHRLVTV